MPVFALKKVVDSLREQGYSSPRNDTNCESEVSMSKAPRYPPASDEVKQSIRDLFGSHDTFALTVQDDGYYVEVTAMYGYVDFDDLGFLTGMRTIADLLGCDEGDEAHRYCTGNGCDTCGYGGSYTVEWRFWKRGDQ